MQIERSINAAASFATGKNLMRRLILAFVGSLVLLTSASVSSAGVIVTVGDATIVAGSTGTLDVTIESSTDLLQSFGFEFRITTAGTTRLEFVDPQGDSQLTDSNYVFSGDSFNEINSFPVGAVSTVTVPNDTFVGGDSTDSFLDVNLTTSKLLATLDLTTLTALAPQVGDTFSVSLLANSINTFFADSGFFPLLSIDMTHSDLTGTVTVVPIPEPTSLAVWSLLGVGGLVHRRRRRQAKA